MRSGSGKSQLANHAGLKRIALFEGARVASWLLASVLVATGCASAGKRDPWTYGLSRGFYDAAFDRPQARLAHPIDDDEGRKAAILYVCVLVVPFALDTLFLPVALVHDIVFVE